MATSRTLVINSKNWRYASKHSSKLYNSDSRWTLAFKPISNSCLEETGYPHGKWGTPEENELQQVN